MGYERHNAIIVTAADFVFMSGSRVPAPDIDAFRASLPEEWRPLIVGPIHAIKNGYRTFLFAPDGSKEGWGTSDEGDEYRQRFLDLFSFAYDDGSSPHDVLIVDARFGGDEPGAEYEDELIVSSNLHRITKHTADTEEPETIRYTADVVCIRDSDTPEVLMIRRLWPPHQGQLALPGGHIDQGETSVDGAVRELAEETGIKVAPEDLALIGLFDTPDRDPRGRYVSAAYLAVVPAGTVAQAGDDAADTEWVALTDRPDELAFDHDRILAAAKKMLGKQR